MPRKAQAKRHNYNETLHWLTGFNRFLKPENEVALEIEVEGEGLPQGLMSYWDVHRDGSLRNNGVEYVLRGPMSRKEIPKALEYLQLSLKEAKARPKQSNRTSVHVHMNCLPLTMKQVLQHVCLYTVFEEPLVRFAGDNRVGNLFCLRASDAEYMVHQLRKAVRSDNYQAYLDNGELLRYSSLNVAALFKYGSLEFRAMRGSVKPEEIQEWLDLLYAVKDTALMYESPAHILQEFSVLGPEQFTKKTFGHVPAFFRKADWEQKLHEGARLIQDVAFAAAWEPKPDDQDDGPVKAVKEAAPDPFEMRWNDDDPDPNPPGGHPANLGLKPKPMRVRLPPADPVPVNPQGPNPLNYADFIRARDALENANPVLIEEFNPQVVAGAGGGGGHRVEDPAGFNYGVIYPAGYARAGGRVSFVALHLPPEYRKIWDDDDRKALENQARRMGYLTPWNRVHEITQIGDSYRVYFI